MRLMCHPSQSLHWLPLAGSLWRAPRPQESPFSAAARMLLICIHTYIHKHLKSVSL